MELKMTSVTDVSCITKKKKKKVFFPPLTTKYVSENVSSLQNLNLLYINVTLGRAQSIPKLT